MPKAGELTGARDFSFIEVGDETALRPDNEAVERLGQYLGKVESRRIPFLPWNGKIPTATGRALDFEMFPFQREWYSDEIVYRRFVAFMKGTQIGASEYSARWAIFFSDTRGDTGLYVFPRQRQLRDFSDQRIKPLIQNSPYLRSRIPRGYIDNKLLKQIGYAFLNFRGSTNGTDLDSVPAGVLVFDEYDDIIQANIPRAEKRLSSPLSRGLIRRLGVPRYSDTGIHAQYEESDQRKWYVKCGKCRKDLPLAFYGEDDRSVHYVDVERGLLVCANCEAPIKPEAVRRGRWVATYPDRDHVGYHVHRLMVPNISVPEIITESKATKPFQVQEFWNSTLGLPYDPAEGRLSKEAIAAAVSAGGNYYQGQQSYTGSGLVTAGIDVASVRDLNVKISEHLDEATKRTLFVGPVADFDQLAVMMDAYRVTFACIDHNPDGRLSRKFAHRFPGRVYLVSWGDGQSEIIKLDEEMSMVSVRRTNTISATLDMIRRQRNHLPVNLPEDYATHMRSAVLKREEDDKGRVVVYYIKTGDDDYLQAEAYDLVATETWWALHLKGRAAREVLQPLEQMMPFERSHVADYDDTAYSPGPQSDESTWGNDDDEPDDFEWVADL